MAIDTSKLYIDGEWVPSQAAETIDVVNPTSEEVIASVPSGTAGDVDKAVAAARAALADWSALSVEKRAELCAKVAELLTERSEEIAKVLTSEMGMPLKLAGIVQVGLPIGHFATMAKEGPCYPWETKVRNSLVLKEPIGVVGAITPWNYPMHQIAAKVAPALLAGNTVVLKPSEVAPLNAYHLMQVLHDAGLPNGVVNMVMGEGPMVGEAIASHPDVDMVSFTGSTRAGKRVAAVAAATVKKVALELGGKSPNVLLPDADFETAVKDGLGKCFLNSGQTCSALTRMLVPRDKLAEVEELAAKAAAGWTTGDPMAKGTRLGPLVSKAQRDRVKELIEKGKAEGAKLVVGDGAVIPDKGYFVPATIFSEVTPEMTIAQEEIFGPVLAIMAYDSEEHAIEIANGTQYGLAGGVWSGDPAKAEQVARRIRAGQVEVNGGAHNPVAPFGGYKQSGVGREYGVFGIDEFVEIKAIQR